MKGTTNAGSSSVIKPEQIEDYNSTAKIAVRGTGLVTTETAPTENGAINWVYE